MVSMAPRKVVRGDEEPGGKLIEGNVCRTSMSGRLLSMKPSKYRLAQTPMGASNKKAIFKVL
jgi:hypothetical protein